MVKSVKPLVSGSEALSRLKTIENLIILATENVLIAGAKKDKEKNERRKRR